MRPLAAKLQWYCGLLLLLAGCWPCGGAETRLRLLHTSDIHGAIADDTGADWLRLATRVQHERTVAGADRTLLIDTGDTIQGSFIAMATRGQAAIQMLQLLQYDVWVPGNHELDYGVARLRELIKPVRDRIICGNFRLTAEPPFPAWRLFRLGPARVAVIGGTAQLLAQWFWGQAASGYTVRPLHAVLAEVLPEVLRQEPDLIVLAVHQGWQENDPRQVNEVARIAKDYPEIDLILGGHTHRAFAGRAISAGCWYVQPAPHAETLAVIDVVVDTARHRVMDLRSRLLPVDGSIPPAPELKAQLQPALRHSHALRQRPIGRAAETIGATGLPGRDCGTSELICRAIAAGTGAAVVLHGKLSDWELRPGPLTELDLYRLVPYENNIGVARLNLDELRRIVAEQWGHRQASAFCGLWGATATISKAGTVSALTVPPGAMDAQQRVQVAFNSYSIAGGGGRFPVLRAILQSEQTTVVECDQSSRELVREYVRRQSPLRLQLPIWLHVRP